jgi:hypothetical protein
VWNTTVTTCGNRTLLLAKSVINGMMLCVDEEGANNERDYWKDALHDLNFEAIPPDVSKVDWAYTIKEKVVTKRQPQWLTHHSNHIELAETMLHQNNND